MKEREKKRKGERLIYTEGGDKAEEGGEERTKEECYRLHMSKRGFEGNT